MMFHSRPSALNIQDLLETQSFRARYLVVADAILV
jgi:hypothetical protein